MKITELKVNPSNHRLIKDERYNKLLKSIKEFPKMLKLRPIIVDNNNVILGGNMRFKALKELGYKELPEEWVKRADELTDEEKRRFIAVDNIGFGEWDWEIVETEWDKQELEAWGLEVPKWAEGSEFNNMDENELDLNEEFDPIGSATDLHKIVFIFDTQEQGSNFLIERLPDIEYKKTCGPAGSIWQVNLSTTYGKK